MTTKPPIAVMSFNRPDYLRQVLISLAAQDDGSHGPIHLFQDGAVSAITGRKAAEPDDIERCIAIFSTIFPDGVVHRSASNIGVAQNFLNAENFFFEDQSSEAAYFFEDDMILSPYYLRLMDFFYDMYRGPKKIGYFAAYGHLKATTADQIKRRTELRRLAHHWGFGLFRHHWLEMQPLMKVFYDVTLGRDYKSRDHDMIRDHYRGNGIMVGVTSQDDVKKAVSYALKRPSLNTFATYGRYIGATGLHMTPEAFERHGYKLTEWLDGVDFGFKHPTDAQIEKMVADEVSGRRVNIEKQVAETAAKVAAKAT